MLPILFPHEHLTMITLSLSLSLWCPFLSSSLVVKCRVYFLRRIWDQCIALYSLGPLERRDVFNVLSLCAPLFSVNKDDRSMYQGDFMEEFDVRKEESLWKMIRKGLVCYKHQVYWF